MGSSEKKDIIPVVIFHVGCPEHLPYSVQSAQRWNERVILLGDEANRKVAGEWLFPCIILQIRLMHSAS